MELIIGPRTYSTWSLRGWLVLKRTGLPFRTIDVLYRTEDQKAALRALSPSGFVPVLRVDGEAIWDTLAIAEWAAERCPEAALWPADPTVRALARSAAAEMHSGFAVLREVCGTGPDHPMVGPSRAETPTDPALAGDLTRLVSLFRQMRSRFGEMGPWLFGQWSVADAFFTPVAARLRHFQIDLAAHGDTDGVAAAYLAELLAQPDFLEWTQDALAGTSGR